MNAQVNTQPPISETILDSAEVVADPTATGRDRYTHLPSGRACVRQPFMTDAQWIGAITAFCSAARDGMLGALGFNAGAVFDTRVN